MTLALVPKSHDPLSTLRTLPKSSKDCGGDSESVAGRLRKVKRIRGNERAFAAITQDPCLGLVGIRS